MARTIAMPVSAGEVGDGAMNLNVHLIERLLHPLDAPRTLGHKIRQLALKGSEPSNRLARAKGSAKKTAAMEQLEPLTIAEVGLAPRHVVELPRVDQHDLDPPRLEQLVDRDPVDVACSPWPPTRHLVRSTSPRDHSVGRSSSQRLARSGVPSSSRRTAHPVLRAAHVDTGNHGLNRREAMLGKGCRFFPLLLVLGLGHILTSCGDGPDPRWRLLWTLTWESAHAVRAT